MEEVLFLEGRSTQENWSTHLSTATASGSGDTEVSETRGLAGGQHRGSNTAWEVLSLVRCLLFCRDNEATTPCPLDCSRNTPTDTRALLFLDAMFRPKVLMSIFQAHCSTVTRFQRPALYCSRSQWVGCQLPLVRVSFCVWILCHLWCVDSCHSQMGLLPDLCLMPHVFYETFLTQDINTFYFQIKYWYTC